jgi:hypothetical protein
MGEKIIKKIGDNENGRTAESESLRRLGCKRLWKTKDEETFVEERVASSIELHDEQVAATRVNRAKCR